MISGNGREGLLFVVVTLERSETESCYDIGNSGIFYLIFVVVVVVAMVLFLL